MDIENHFKNIKDDRTKVRIYADRREKIIGLSTRGDYWEKIKGRRS